MDFLKRTFPILFGIFLLSVAVRWPQLNRPLSNHHEFCTAISLRIMQAWYDEGISRFEYNPAMNYGHSTDKHINNHANQTGGLIDENGNYYYVSHPPFAYYFPYFIFKLLHIRPDVMPIRIFNLALHFISGLFVYFIVCLLSFSRARAMPYRSAIVAFAIYIFLPVTMWFQGNVYMSDMAVHTVFVIGVYTVLKMIIRQKFYSYKYIFFYVVSLSLMLYTSWLGVFFAAGVLIYSLLHVQQIKGFKVLIAATVLCLIAISQIVIYQYSQIHGPMNFFSEMISRYMVRGSFADTKHGLLHFMFGYLWFAKTLLYNYVLHYNVFFLLLIGFIYVAATHKKLKIVFSENGYRFIWLSVAPVVMLHVLFLNYSVHDFTTLYASLFFSVLFGILYDKLKKSGSISLRKMQVSLVVVLLLLVAQFHVYNQGTDYYLNAGKLIAENATTNEVIFTNQQMLMEPQVIFYAQRNVRFAEDTADAKLFLKRTKQQNGVFITTHSRAGGVVIQSKTPVSAEP
ncbi:MAG: hypothetical protein JNK66_09325 [Chitinophagales bacterium]|nr:hypothetical protein [Chitinophagales bacterium]